MLRAMSASDCTCGYDFRDGQAVCLECFLQRRFAVTGKDLHTALKSETIAKASGDGLEVVLTRLQWGKEDVGFSLHVNPTSFTSAGIQETDFLSYLGFQRYDGCPFTGMQRCFAREVDGALDVAEFALAFGRAFKELEAAERGLEACGFRLRQPEGWGFRFGREGGRSSRGLSLESLRGDGHNAKSGKGMKQTEDDTFLFRFTFIETESDKHFVTHYRPKHHMRASAAQPQRSRVRSRPRTLG
jgi:hypothetical protein